MNLLEMLTQKRTDPLSSFVAREKMIRRNPMKFVGDTATRLGGGDPDASVLDLVVDHETTPRTPDIIAESPDTGKKGNGKLKGAITDIGGMLASALSPEQKTPLQFAPMQRQEFMPIADPRFLKYAGGRKKGGPIRVGTYATVHDDEKVANLGDGQVEVIPAHEDVPTLNEQIAVDEDLGTQIPLDAPDEKIAINETPTTATVTEQVKQPTIADKLGAQINAYQDPDRYKKGSEFYDKKRNWKDALRSAGYGLLQSLASAPPTNDVGALLGRAIGGAGTGAVMGATMDNVDEKMRDQFKLAQLMPQYQNAYGMERQKQADEIAKRNAESIRIDREMDNKRLQADAERKLAKDQATIAYWNRKADQGDLKLANDAELLALRDKWMTSKDKTDSRRLDLVEREIIERTKRNEANINSRAKIAGMNAASAERRAQLRIEAAKLRTELQEAEKTKRADKVNEIRLRLKGIIDEVDGFTAPATGEAILN